MTTDRRGEIITKIRSLKWTIPQTAEKAGLNKGTVYNYLKGESSIQSNNLKRLLAALELPE